MRVLFCPRKLLFAAIKEITILFSTHWQKLWKSGEVDWQTRGVARIFSEVRTILQNCFALPPPPRPIALHFPHPPPPPPRPPKKTPNQLPSLKTWKKTFGWREKKTFQRNRVEWIEGSYALKIIILRHFAFFLEWTLFFIIYSLYIFFVHDFFR